MEVLSQLVINSLIVGALYALLAISFSLIYSATKFFNLAHGVFAAIGGYAVFLFGKMIGLPLYLAIVFGVISAGALGYGLDKAVFLPLRRRKATTMVLLVASLGLMTMGSALLQIAFGSQFRSLREVSQPVGILNIFGASLTSIQLIIIGMSVVLSLGLIVFLRQTLFGKAVRAISDDEEVAKIVGINTDWIVGYVFFIGAAVAGLAGIMQGFDTGLEPFMGLRLLLKAVIAAIIGGVGSLPGAVLGAYLLAFVENFGIWQLSAEWKDAIAFTLLIVFLIFRPRGIFGK